MANKRTGQDYLDYRKNPEPRRPKLERRKSTPSKKTRWSDSSLTPTQRRQVELQEKKDKMWKEKMRKKYSTKQKK